MKKLLGLALAGTAVATAMTGCGSESLELNNGIYTVTGVGHGDRDIDLAVKVSGNVIDSVKVINSNQSDAQWDAAWAELGTAFDGMTAAELNDYTAADADVSGSTMSVNGVIDAVQSVINNEDNLVNFAEGKTTNGELTSILGDFFGKSLEVDTYEGSMGPAVCTLAGATDATLTDTDTVSRIAADGATYTYSTEGYWGGFSFVTMGPVTLTWDEIYNNAGAIDLVVLSAIHHAAEADCPGYVAA